MNKPEPIRVGVEGIAPAPAPARTERIDWTRLIGLPPFQLYAAERGGRRPTASWPESASGSVRRMNECSTPITVAGTPAKAAGRARRRWAK